MALSSGDTVRVHYTGRLADGTQFDSSAGGEPLEFTIGSCQVLPGFEAAVAQLEPGQSTTVTIPAAEAYGERDKLATLTVPRSSFGDTEPVWGARVVAEGSDGRKVVGLVGLVDDERVILDINHPLAGKDVTFDIELVSVTRG